MNRGRRCQESWQQVVENTYTTMHERLQVAIGH
jgi:hypothetical protein